MRGIDPPDNLLGFFVLKRAFSYDARLRLPGRIKICAGKMQPFEQRVTAAALLRGRSGKRLQALVKRVIPRGNGFHLGKIQNGGASTPCSAVAASSTPAATTGNTIPSRACASRTGANECR